MPTEPVEEDKSIRTYAPDIYSYAAYMQTASTTIVGVKAMDDLVHPPSPGFRLISGCFIEYLVENSVSVLSHCVLTFGWFVP